jgi:hypothetical protein
MSEILANKLSPSTGTTVTLGDSGDTFNIPSGVTLTNNGTMNASAITAGTLPIARGGTGSTSTTFVNAATNITGSLPVGNLNGGTSASSSTFWRGDGAWAAAGGDNTPSFFANQASTQSISNGSQTKVTLGTEIWDTDSAFASDKFTVPAGGAGKYAFQFGGLLVNMTTNGYFQIGLYKNGARLTGGAGASRVFMSTAIAQDVPFASSTVTTLADSDYIELYVYQNNQDGGGGSRTLGDANYLAYLGGWRLIGV